MSTTSTPSLPGAPDAPDSPDAARIVQAIDRPDRSLLTYYILLSLCFGPLVVFALPYLYFRYHTMRYVFDDEGVSMRWGALFRREISLTYARIQDIHLVSNAVERHLGLARLKVQTAAGSATAEMTIEGLPQFEQVRDVLYERMRGRGSGRSGSGRRETRSDDTVRAGAASVRPDEIEAVVAALRETTDELRRLREALGDPSTRSGASSRTSSDTSSDTGASS